MSWRHHEGRENYDTHAAPVDYENTSSTRPRNPSLWPDTDQAGGGLMEDLE